MNAYDFQKTFEAMNMHERYACWLETLPEQVLGNLNNLKHGDLNTWQEALAKLPDISIADDYVLGDCIRIGNSNHLDDIQKEELEQQLKQLCPWRKGPFDFFGIHIDTEWRSDWKWKRLQEHIEPLHNHHVLDVGCGNGYHLWRIREAGASFVIGIDPSLLFLNQFHACKQYLEKEPVHLLPLRSEDLPEKLSAFDTVFSMGVLYHRRSPLDHLIELRNALKPSGQLVLETLIIDQPGQNILFPEDRYAMMRNVFFLPSLELLSEWLKRCGFIDIKLININKTSIEEQRVTEWVKAQSLKDFLNPENHDLTIEGYPAPLRACISARKDPKFQ